MKGFFIEVTNNLLDPNHRARIGTAIWEFLWCLDKITMIDEEGIGWLLGKGKIKRADLCAEIGIAERHVSNNLRKLEREGYLKLIRKSDGFIIGVCKAKKRYNQKVTSEVTKRLLRKEQKVTSLEVYKDDKTVGQDKDKTNIQKVVDYFFELKGWANKEKSFYASKSIVYGRFVKPAKDLLALCEGSVEESKFCLLKVSEWARSRDLEWGIETVFKKWYDIDALKPKEKKPYYDNCRIFQKVEGGRWYIVRPDGVKELGIIPDKKLVAYK